MRRTFVRLTPFLLTCLIVCRACQPSAVYHQQESIDPEGWHYQDGILFEATVEDTLSLHELYLDVRNTTDYAYSNLFLFLEIEFPDNRTLKDTLECILADRKGHWTGKGFGHVRSNRFLFRDDVWFPVEGTYRFTIHHGMRDDSLTGLSDIGIRIERK